MAWTFWTNPERGLQQSYNSYKDAVSYKLEWLRDRMEDENEETQLQTIWKAYQKIKKMLVDESRNDNIDYSVVSATWLCQKLTEKGL